MPAAMVFFVIAMTLLVTWYLLKLSMLVHIHIQLSHISKSMLLRIGSWSRIGLEKNDSFMSLEAMVIL